MKKEKVSACVIKPNLFHRSSCTLYSTQISAVFMDQPVLITAARLQSEPCSPSPVSEAECYSYLHSHQPENAVL